MTGGPTGILLLDVLDTSLRQRDVARSYAQGLLLMHAGVELDWKVINRAIIDRWSLNGLVRVKEMAWKQLEA